MKTLLLKADYRDNTGKFWRDSYIKNLTATQLKGETVHDTVKRIIQQTDGLELSYKGKLQSTVYRDTTADKPKVVGYIYRAKDEIDGKKALFDVWVEIREVLDLPLKELELN